jgi:DNA polymerase lambda
MEIIDTGILRRVDAARTEDVAAIQLFQGIYGVGMCGVPLRSRISRPQLPFSGQSTAYAWYLAGRCTLEDIKQRKGGVELSHVQQIGLKYYDGARCSFTSDKKQRLFVDRHRIDINARMSREEASEIFGEIKSIGEPSRRASFG